MSPIETQSVPPHLSRRKAIAVGCARIVALIASVNHLPLIASPSITTSTDNNMALIHFVNTLRAMKNEACNAAADSIQAALATGEDLYLHLRNAGLDPIGALTIARALDALAMNTEKPLISFSVSYNPQLSDSGAIALAQSLPHTLREIGFVSCNLKDDGGVALLEWAKQNPNLKMICIEGNLFTRQTQSLYRKFGQNNPDITVII